MFLCIDIDSFFVSVEQALNPDLRGKPVIVGGLPGDRAVVASASYEARRFGISSGMPISRASRLCPCAVFIRPNFNKYETFSNRFRQLLSNYSPLVEMVSIDEAFVDIRGTERLFGQPLVLARRLKEEIKEKLNLPSSTGIARTRVLSKIACDVSKPDGLLMIAPEEEKNFLSPLSVGLLPGIGPKRLEVLKNLNINTVGEFLNAPDFVLNTAMGKNYKAIKSLINGGDYRILHSMKSMTQEITLPEDTINFELITGIFYRLIESLCQRMRENGLGARILKIKLRFSDFKTITKMIRLPLLMNSHQKIYEYALPALREMLKEKKRVRLLGAGLSGFEYYGLQPSIFFVREDRLNRFNYALDKIRNRFGFNSVFPGKTLSIKTISNNHTGIYAPPL